MCDQNVDWWVLLPRRVDDDDNPKEASDSQHDQVEESKGEPGLTRIFAHHLAVRCKNQSSFFIQNNRMCLLFFFHTESYVLVEDKDVVEGIADTVVAVVRATPETKTLDHRQLQSLLSDSFSQLRTNQSLIGRLWRVGKLAYSAYGWAKYDFNDRRR
jgi:hypothetical protein